MTLKKITINLWTMWIGLLLIPSCNNSPSADRTSTVYKNVKIEIYSPGGCYNEIQINNSGIDSSIVGFHNVEGIKTPKWKKSFVISAEADMKNFERLIDHIKVNPDIGFGHEYDLYHFAVTVDKEKIIDRGGQSKILDSLLLILLPYARHNNVEQCDYFYLLEENLDSLSNAHQ